MPSRRELLRLLGTGAGGIGDLTVTVGIGPRLVTTLDPSIGIGADSLPAFRGDGDIDP